MCGAVRCGGSELGSAWSNRAISWVGGWRLGDSFRPETGPEPHSAGAAHFGAVVGAETAAGAGAVGGDDGAGAGEEGGVSADEVEGWFGHGFEGGPAVSIRMY